VVPCASGKNGSWHLFILKYFAATNFAKIKKKIFWKTKSLGIILTPYVCANFCISTIFGF